MATPRIEVSLHAIVVEGVRIERPARIGVSDWVKFWEYVIADGTRCPECGWELR